MPSLNVSRIEESFHHIYQTYPSATFRHMLSPKNQLPSSSPSHSSWHSLPTQNISSRISKPCVGKRHTWTYLEYSNPPHLTAPSTRPECAGLLRDWIYRFLDKSRQGSSSISSNPLTFTLTFTFNLSYYTPFESELFITDIRNLRCKSKYDLPPFPTQQMQPSTNKNASDEMDRVCLVLKTPKTS